jgi:ABC-type sugar transport system ATPase subunit
MSDLPGAKTEPALELRGLCKRYGAVQVLKGIHLDLAVGRILGLVGENGAGKSTLMNVLGGAIAPESGQMRLFGRPYQPRTPAEAGRAGIAFIHQELNLFPNLTVAENLFLTAFPRHRFGGIDRGALEAKARALLLQAGLSLDPSEPVERLSAGERQQVEIAKALGQNARLVLFDEPTTSLSAREIERLFALIRALRERGVTVIYISHQLQDVLGLCDEIAVLRDGELAGTGPIQEFDIPKLVALMVGRRLDQLYPTRERRPGVEVALEARNLTQPGQIHNVNFQLRAGEVLGLAGLMGSGRSELARILFGLEPAKGEIRLMGRPLGRGVRQRIQGGMAFLTESRREEGLWLQGPLTANLELAGLSRFNRMAGFLAGDRLGQAIQEMRAAVRLTPALRDEQPVGTLSGGNQQKIVLGKWLLAQPRVLILDEPTRGIDVGAKYELYQLIHQLADQGTAVLVISSELEELLGMCDRLLVMRRGEIVDEAPRAEFQRERILRAALGA